jgi:hypothetical protein
MSLVEFLATAAVDPDGLTSLVLDPDDALRRAGLPADALSRSSGPGPKPPEPEPPTVFVVSTAS